MACLGVNRTDLKKMEKVLATKNNIVMIFYHKTIMCTMFTSFA